MNARNIERGLPALGALLLGLSFLALRLGTEAQKGWGSLPSALAQPVPPQITRFSLVAAWSGMRRVGADWTYIDALQYIGTSSNRLDGRYRRTLELYREVLWLDPHFHFAVLEGASMLGWNLRRIGEAQELLEAAMRIDPSFARYRLYYAALGYQAQGGDPNRVLNVLRDEVRRPEAPEMLLRIVGNIYMKHQDWEGARVYWSWILRRAREKETLDLARKNLKLALERLR